MPTTPKTPFLKQGEPDAIQRGLPSPVRRHLKLDSSNIDAVGYAVGEKLLEVVFKDNPAEVYSYQSVPSTVFLELINAESVGSYFSKHIRSKPGLYPWTKRKA